MVDISLTVKRLLLDEQNPRHRAVTTQEQALAELIRRGPQKLFNLAKDIAVNGLSPVDNLIVLKTERGHVMLEGNRRLAALKMLNDPSLCPNPALRRRFAQVAANAGVVIPKRVRCVVVNSRGEARIWLDRRHGGEMDGAGTVRWGAIQRTRNAENPARQERAALAVLDWLDGKSAAGANTTLGQAVEQVGEEKFTTFGRLAESRQFKDYCGFELNGDLLSTKDTSEAVVSRLTLVLQDMTGRRNLTVTELRTRAAIKTYIDSELRPRMAGADETELSDDETDPADDAAPENDNEDEAAETNSSSEPEQEPEVEPDDKPEPAPPMKLFVELSLSHCSRRNRAVLREVQRIALRSYPNSAAALIRMVIELTVMEAHDKCGWAQPPQQKLTLRHWVENSMIQLDPTRRSRKYQDLRTQLGQPNSLVSTATLNAFLHNPHYAPSAPDMRTISDKYSILLADLNEAIGDAKDSS